MRLASAIEDGFGALAVALFAFSFRITKPSALLWLAIWTCPSVGALSSLYSFQFSGLEIRLSGLISALLLGGSAVLVGWNARRAWEITKRDFHFFFLFVSFAAIRIADAPDHWLAVKEVAIFATPLAIAVVAQITFSRGLQVSWARRNLLLCALLTLAVAVFQILIGAIGFDAEGLVSNVGRATIASFCLPLLALALSCWRYGQDKKFAVAMTIVLLTLILMTVERMAAVVALLVLLPLRFFDFEGRIVPVLLRGIAMAFLSGLLLLQIPVLRHRFLENKETPAFQVEEAIINTSGRSEMWYVTIVDALEKPFSGHGTGSSEVLIPEMVPGLDHPHNEYLRVWHDLGAVGLALFLIAWVGRSVKHFRGWKSARNNPELAQPNMAAALASLATMLSYVIDNTLIYTFFQIPVFLIFAIADRSVTIQANKL